MRPRARQLTFDELERRDTPAVVGGLDGSFGVAGLASFNAGGGDVAADVVADPLGGYVIAGFTPGPGGGDFLVLRLRPDGTPDPTFGTGGRVVIDFAGSDDRGRRVSFDPAGNILVGGYADPGTGKQIAVARLTPAGAPDPGFGTAGQLVIASPGATAEAAAVLPDPTGNVVVVATVTSGGLGEFAAGRITPAGAFDPTFGVGGKISFHFGAGTNDTVGGAYRDAGGNLLLAGASATGGVGKFAVARLTAAGAFDPTFGTGGKVAFNLAAGASDTGLAAAPDDAGRIVVVGRSAVGMDVQAGVARLTPNGAPDPTFSGDGFLRTTVGGVVGIAFDVAVDPAGRVVVAGLNGGPTSDFVALRVTPDGTPDPSFNPGGPSPGQATVDFAGGSDAATAVALSPGGRIVVAGYRAAPPFGVEVARLLGSVEEGRRLAVGGSPNGVAQVFVPAAATGHYTPGGPVSGLGAVTANARTAVGDVNGDGTDDTILVTGAGAAIRVAVVSGADDKTVLVAPFDPFGGDFTGGGFVAAGDLDHDGREEFVVTPDQGGGPRVTVFTLRPDGSLATRANFFGIDDPAFRGGCRAALGDVDGDGTADLAVAAGFLGGPRVALFDGPTVLATPTRLVGDFFAFPGDDATRLRNGAFVAVGDVDGDGFADLVFGAGPGGAPRVFVLGGALVSAGNVTGAYTAPVANFFVAGNDADRGGVRVATTDADTDHRAEVVAGSGEGSPARARVYLGKNFGGGEPTTFQDLDPYAGVVLTGGVFVG